MTTPTRIRSAALATLFAAIAASTPATAIATETAAGPRIGLTVDPDQLVLGGALMFTHVGVPNLRIEPNALVGIGDDLFTLRFSGDFKYLFPIPSSMDIALYPLVGLSFEYYSFDNDNCRGCDGTFSEFGVNLGGGLQISAFTIDLYFGLGDITDVTLTAGYNFRI